ncbi:hypothetical protein ACVRXQ_02695 [Streptococcus panodentis]|uniref:Cingulin n=1 Tax=Streptococcus panodentis TaxID=1581472 RepID=A0ABS5AYZ2_9STRE|nr:hypothetical protein [Streptococcus panodentis]MBP2621802.1 hypothetical protein [Streptococcus panodentis]
MNEEIYKLDEQFDKSMRELKKKEEYLEDNLSYILYTTEQLKDEVYQIADGELPVEAYTDIFQMDTNAELFQKEVLEQIDDIDEKRSKLRWDYEEHLDALYKKKAREQDD